MIIMINIFYCYVYMIMIWWQCTRTHRTTTRLIYIYTTTYVSYLSMSWSIKYRIKERYALALSLSHAVSSNTVGVISPSHTPSRCRWLFLPFLCEYWSHHMKRTYTHSLRVYWEKGNRTGLEEWRDETIRV